MKFFIVLLVSLFVSPALAGMVLYPSPDREETGYVGMVWTLSGGLNQTPEVNVGFQSSDVAFNGDIDEGYDISLRFAWNAMRLPTNYSLRASSLFGDNDTITNVGLGLNHNGKLLLTAGVQVDYLRVGLDLSANGLKTTGEILSLELPDAPQAIIPF